MAGLLGATVVVLTPSPASAHGVGGIEPSNYRTRLLAVEPARPGIAVRAVDLGTRLELENTGNSDVVVLGDDSEPYLRVGPRGAFENVRSPATYRNRTRRADDTREPGPPEADPSARPRWRRIGDDPVVRWRDHRAYPTTTTDPPAVRDDPDHVHLVQQFQIEIVQRGHHSLVRGDVRWVPGPSPWPWIAGALALAVAVALISRARHSRGTVTAVLVLVGSSEIMHLVGGWGATTVGTGERLGAGIYAIGAITTAAIALVAVVGRGADRAAPLVLASGLFLALAGGLADVTVFQRSGIPTTLTPDLARLTVMIALGAGLGLAVAGGLRLRISERAR